MFSHLLVFFICLQVVVFLMRSMCCENQKVFSLFACALSICKCCFFFSCGRLRSQGLLFSTSATLYNIIIHHYPISVTCGHS